MKKSKYFAVLVVVFVVATAMSRQKADSVAKVNQPDLIRAAMTHAEKIAELRKSSGEKAYQYFSEQMKPQLSAEQQTPHTMVPLYLVATYGVEIASTVLDLANFRSVNRVVQAGGKNIPISKDKDFLPMLKYLHEKAVSLDLTFEFLPRLDDKTFNFDDYLKQREPVGIRITSKKVTDGKPHIGFVTHADVVDVSDRDAAESWLFGGPFPPKVIDLPEGGEIPTTYEARKSFDALSKAAKQQYKYVDRKSIDHRFVTDNLLEKRKSVFFGRGVGDDKAGIVASIFALRAVQDAFPKGEHNGAVYIALGEEKLDQWAPFEATMKGIANELPAINIIADSNGIIRGETAINPTTITFSAPPITKKPAQNAFHVEYFGTGPKAFNQVPALATTKLKPTKWTSNESPTDTVRRIAEKHLGKERVEVKREGAVILLTVEGFTQHTKSAEKGKNALIDTAMILNQLALSGTSPFEPTIKFLTTYFTIDGKHDVQGRKLGLYATSDTFKDKDGNLVSTVTSPNRLIHAENKDGTIKSVSLSVDLRHPDTLSRQQAQTQLGKIASEFSAAKLTVSLAPLPVLNGPIVFDSKRYGKLLSYLRQTSTRYYGEPMPMYATRGGTHTRVMNRVKPGEIIGINVGPWRTATNLLGYHGFNENGPAREVFQAAQLFSSLIIDAKQVPLPER